MEIISAEYIPTDLRDIAEYIIRFPRSNDTVYVYSAHLKAGNPDFSEDDEDLQRLAEVTILRDNHLNHHSQGTKFIVSGDLNLYASDEPAYQKLLTEEPGNYGHSFDPINRPGGWHNNASFSDIHTQSSRTTDLGDGGSTGGMDDRFDFILVSEPLLEKVETGTYKAFGNDGNHFNQAINNGTNSAVSSEVADALHLGSDHLPVIVDFDLSISSLESENDFDLSTNFKLIQNYPNPFNPRTTINYELQFTNYVELGVYNLLGKKIAILVSEKQSAGNYSIKWDASGFAGGVYFYKIAVGNSMEIKKMVLLR
jgi:endonuclease/exonuclease/phosphatase family metal-dependent hydrolase